MEKWSDFNDQKFLKKILSEISREISTKIKKKTAVSEDDSVAKGI